MFNIEIIEPTIKETQERLAHLKAEVFKYQQQFAELIFSGNYTKELYNITLNRLNSARAALTSVQDYLAQEGGAS